MANLNTEQAEREQRRLKDNERYLWYLAWRDLREQQLGCVALAYLRRIDYGTTAN